MGSGKNEANIRKHGVTFAEASTRGLRRAANGGSMRSGTNVVLLDPDVAEVFPDSAAVNRALRALAGIIKERSQAPAA